MSPTLIPPSAVARRCGLLGLLLPLLGCDAAPSAAPDAERRPWQLESLESGTTERLQSISIVDDETIWVSGVGGTVLRSVDDGSTWHDVSPSSSSDPLETDALQFRDIEAHSLAGATILAAGPGDASRIYATDDGGATWTPEWTNEDPDGFFNCITSDGTDLYLVGDSQDGRLPVWIGRDGSWAPLAGIPVGDGEAGFAASGDCVVFELGELWVTTGGAGVTRVSRSRDNGRTWTSHDTGIEAPTAASGAFAIEASTDLWVVAGNLEGEGDLGPRLAYSGDRGSTWTHLSPPIPGALYDVATDESTVVVVGPGGVTISEDDGASFTTLTSSSYWAVERLATDRFVLAGPAGRIALLERAP